MRNRRLARYQRFIDLLVERSYSVGAMCARRGVWNPNLLPGQPHAERLQQELPRQASAQRLLDELTPDQREILAQMLEDAREGGFHDVLVALTDEDYRLSRYDARLPVQPYNTPLFFDYVARRAGQEWPPESEAEL